MDVKQYGSAVKAASPKTKCPRNCLMAFLFGGALACLAQAAADVAEALGADAGTSGTWGSLFLIFVAAVLTALNVFDELGKLAGAGTLVPITGFANSVVSSGMEFRSEGLIFGTGVKIFQIAGPVIVYGSVFSVIYGIFYVIFR